MKYNPKSSTIIRGNKPVTSAKVSNILKIIKPCNYKGIS